MGALDYRDKIRSLIEQRPVQPTEIAKELKTNSMLASAMLSEMSEKGLLKVSHIKIGSSPLYYHPDHPDHLLNYIPHLNEKDRKTAAALKEQKVMRDQTQDPLTRVSLRSIKDFAKPLDVSIDGVKEMFWKFYLFTDEEAAASIKQLIQPKEAPAPQAVAKPRKPRARKHAPAIEPQQTITQPVVAEPVPRAAPAVEPAPQPVGQAPTAPATQAIADDPFLQQLLAFFAANSITVLEQVVLKRKAEYDFVIQLTSPVGQLHYYCKAKNKAKVGEADLSHAFVQGQLKKLPILFVTPGVLTKPAQDLLKELKGLTVKQV